MFIYALCMNIWLMFIYRHEGNRSIKPSVKSPPWWQSVRCSQRSVNGVDSSLEIEFVDLNHVSDMDERLEEM